MTFQWVENEEEKRDLERKIRVKIGLVILPALVVLRWDSDEGVEGSPEVLVVSWADVVYMMLMKKGRDRARYFLEESLKRDEEEKKKRRGK